MSCEICGSKEHYFTKCDNSGFNFEKEKPLFGSKTYNRLYYGKHPKIKDGLYLMDEIAKFAGRLARGVQRYGRKRDKINEMIADTLLQKPTTNIIMNKKSNLSAEHETLSKFLWFLSYVESDTKRTDYLTKAMVEYISILINKKMKSLGINQVMVDGLVPLEIFEDGLKWKNDKFPLGMTAKSKPNLNFIHNRYLIFEKLIKLSKKKKEK